MSDFASWIDFGDSVGFRKTVNPKKPLRLKNPSKFFVPFKDKTHVVVQSQSSYSSRQSKIEGYETRLYYEFLRTRELGGQTFYYTLTYNDKSVPKYLGKNCFDYEDLRYLLNGGFKKILERKFGIKLRYFVGAELGDGKGQRGLSNNPHYHVLFFLRPDDTSENPSPYVKIQPELFRHFVRRYWQGFDEDTDGWHSYKDSKYGIAKEGEDCGLVSDFRAVQYVAKYVCKDAGLRMHEINVYRHAVSRFRLQYKYSVDSYFEFFNEVIYPIFNIPKDVNRSSWVLDDKDLFKLLAVRICLYVDHRVFDSDEWLSFRLPIIKSSINYYNLGKRYSDFVDFKCSLKASDELRVYRNRYCNKCRISQGVGISALNAIADYLHPSIPFPSKNGIKHRPIGLYLYRKLYNGIYIDLEGRTYYVLNSLGIEYKLANLDSNISKISNLACSRLEKVSFDRSLYEKMLSSDVNTEVSCSFDAFRSLLSELTKDVSLLNICQRYATYKLVYEDRFFKTVLEEGCSSPSFPDISPSSDLFSFLQSSIGTVSRSDYRLDLFLENPDSDCLPYFSHPYFLQFSGVFSVLDLISDYFFVTQDDKLQKQAEEIKSVKRFHDKRKLDEYYSKFYMPYGKIN